MTSLGEMTAVRSKTCSHSLDTQLSRVGSIPNEWQRSTIHMHGSSVELFNVKLPHTSSLASSGYWEDYESIDTSAYEHLNESHLNLTKSHRLNGSCATVVSSTWNPTAQSARVQADQDADEWSFGKPQSNNQLYDYHTFASFDDEDDRLHSPKSVLLKIPAPMIPLNLSTELLQSQSQSTLDLKGVVTDRPHSSIGKTALMRQELPRQHSAPTQSQSILDAVTNKKTAGIHHSSPHRTRYKLCSSLDASDSEEEDDCGSSGQRPEPRTLFEAALRRARLADSQREVNLNAAAKSGRSMPDWGSPIRMKRPTATTTTTLTKDEVQGFDCDEAQNIMIASEMEKDNPTGIDKTKTKVSSSNQEFSCEQHLDQVVPPRALDWCTGMERWMNDRPRWLYQTKSDANSHTLQLCYLTESMENMCSDDTVDSMVLDSESTYQNGTLDSIENHQQTGSIPELSMPVNKDSVRGQLFRNEYEPDKVKSRLEKAEQYCDLYFKQRGQDCTSASSEKKLAHLQEKCKKTHQDVHFSLSQVNRIAHMQVELEKPVWSVISSNIADMLHIPVKPRNILSSSTLSQLTCFQLQLIVNHIYNVIQDLNCILMESLMERDELHLEHGAKLTELDDLLSYLKELCIRASIRHYRRQLSIADSGDQFAFNMEQNSSHDKRSTHNHPVPRRSTIDPNQYKVTQPCSRLTLKQRIVSAFTRRNSTAC